MFLDPILDILRGKAITVPPLDGAFLANTALDQAPELGRLPAPDNLVLHQGNVIASSGSAIYQLAAGSSPKLVQSCPGPVTALAVSPQGELVVALENGALEIDGRPMPLPQGIRCITALDFAANGQLWLANGSSRHQPTDWARDLMEKNASGSVWVRDADRQTWRQRAGSLAWPYGILADESGATVSESWRHRLIRIGREDSSPQPILRHLPGYPARLSRAGGDGVWLAVFAPRNRLIQLVLQESHFRYDMMATVPRDFWIAPALSSGNSFLEPLQCGGIRVMGIHKPWAPSRSYGLVVRLDGDMQPRASLHSRADGTRHGICSAIEHDGALLVASKGGDTVLSVNTTAAEGV